MIFCVDAIKIVCALKIALPVSLLFGLLNGTVKNVSFTNAVHNGGYGFISALKKEDIRLFVDAAGLEAGEYTLPVQIDIDNAPEFSCALSAPEITVTLTEK